MSLKKARNQLMGNLGEFVFCIIVEKAIGIYKKNNALRTFLLKLNSA